MLLLHLYHWLPKMLKLFLQFLPVLGILLLVLIMTTCVLFALWPKWFDNVLDTFSLDRVRSAMMNKANKQDRSPQPRIHRPQHRSGRNVVK